MINSTLIHSIKLFEYYKSLGEKAMAQVRDDALWWTPDAKSNSISVIVKHLHGNMLSRWTDCGASKSITDFSHRRRLSKLRENHGQ